MCLLHGFCLATMPAKARSAVAGRVQFLPAHHQPAWTEGAATVPAPMTERQVLERERDELPALITTYEHELLATPVEEMEKREQLRWQLRLAEKRLAEINARLTS